MAQRKAIKKPRTAKPRKKPAKATSRAAKKRENRAKAAESSRGGAVCRLHVALARAGVCSRRQAEKLITAGEVRVNGRVVRELGTSVDPASDRITVGGKALKPPAPLRYLAFHKPDGMLTTMSDPRGRPCVGDLLEGAGVKLFPVGRLDFHSSGLLLLTNDGELCQRLTHPRYHVEKTYRVKVSGVPSDAQIESLRRGVRLEDGRTAPAYVRVEKTTPSKAWLEMRIHEGRNRQLRRMLEAVGLRVDKLRRTAVGPVRLGRLPAGSFRPLEEGEVRALRAAAGLDEGTPRTGRSRRDKRAG
ncbi:MAG: rRNA pseudouridine synthase [Deltaproteobacteria bacterium]|nr:MAG: rRNA pseudouridine synthase [Deltaproteobacteria bacterium]